MSFQTLQTRPELGLRSPRSISRNISPASGGVAIHYGGPRVGITEHTPHSRCRAVWQSWQRYHMDTHGWADIAYTGAACQHGYLLRGRGIGVRTAAQGSNTGNQNYYALVWIGGEGDTPSSAAIAALDEGIRRLRAAGAGDRVRPHSDFNSTACPGSALKQYAASRDRKPIEPSDTYTPGGVETMGSSRFTLDGIMDAATVVALQKIWGAPPTRRFDKATIAAMQRWLGVADDGIVGPVTLRALYDRIGYEGTGGWSYLWTDRPTPQTRLLERHMNEEADRFSAAPDWPLPSTHRIGPNPNKRSTWHDGTGNDTAGRAAIRRWQSRMAERGWSITADGYWGPQSAAVASAFQTEKRIRDGDHGNRVGPATWEVAWSAPIT